MTISRVAAAAGHWTKAETCQLKEAYFRGKTVPQIAGTIPGKTYANIRMQMFRLGLPSRHFRAPTIDADVVAGAVSDARSGHAGAFATLTHDSGVVA